MNKNDMIEVDYSDLAKSCKLHLRKTAPLAFARGFQKLTKYIEIAEKRGLKNDLDVHGKFVINSIKAFPSTKNQVNKIARDVKNKHKFIAQVATNDKTSFLSMHDTGGTRRVEHHANYLPSGENKNVLAIPSYYTLRQKKYRTKTGKVKKMYQPKQLIKDFNKNGKRTHSKRKLAFLMRAKSGHLMIVKRTTKKAKPISILYHFVNSAKIDNDWNWSELGDKVIKQRYKASMASMWNLTNKQNKKG